MSKKIYCLFLMFVMLMAVSVVAASEDANIEDAKLADDNAAIDIDNSNDKLSTNNVPSDVATASDDNTLKSGDVDPNFNVKTEVNDEGEIIINITGDKNVTGKVSFNVTDSKNETITSSSMELENGSAVFTDDHAFPKGTYNIYVNYAGNAYYKNFTYVGHETVTKLIPILNINSISVDEYGAIVIKGFVNRNATGTVRFTFKNDANSTPQIHDVDVGENGTIEYNELTPFAKGLWNIKTQYNGDDNYFKSEELENEITVSKYSPTLDINVTVNEYGQIVINGKVNETATGNVTFVFTMIDYKTFNVTIPVGENGTVEYNELEPFAKGSWTINAQYNGDSNFYKSGDIIREIAVEKDIAQINNITVKVYDTYVDIDVAFNTTLTGLVNISIFSDKKNYTTSENINGKTISFTDIELPVGDYKVRADYAGDSNYYATYGEEAFEVRAESTIEMDSIVNEYGSIVITAEVPKNATGTITFTIINKKTNETKTVTANVVNGTASYNELDTFAKGEYKTIARYNGDDYYFAKEDSMDVNVTKTAPVIDSKVTISGTTVTITVNIANATGNVTFFITPNENTTLALNNGTVSYTGKFNYGDNAVTAEYNGDEGNYKAFSIIGFIVQKTSAFNKISNVKVVYSKNGKVTVILRDNTKAAIANAVVTVTVNKKTYTAKTNAKGQATLTIPAKMVPKTYAATAKYAGSEYYKGTSSNFKFAVKKANPKLNAKNKAFKAKKVKKYAVTLKDNNGKALKKAKLILKVKGKKYSALTNGKGIAVFKIKLTKAGNYASTVTYNGNKYYNKVSKKAVIKII